MNWMLSGAFWIVFGVLMGSVLTLEFVFPDLFAGVPVLVFSRLRQAHTNTVMFAFLSTGMIGLWYYIVPRLTARKLWSELLGNIAMVLWNVAVLIGVVAILLSHTQSREYAELIWPVDVLVEIVLVLNLVNLYMTIWNRVENRLFVSLWYIIGTLIWMPALYFIGNVMWNPPTGALTGINDAIFNWFYGHNVLGLWFTTGLIAVIYYIVPRETSTPLYSHFVSLIAFWGIALFYTGVGAHHLLWAPIPYWLRTISVAESIGMVIPVAAFLFNILLTMRGNWSRAGASLPLRYALTGFFAYIATSFLGSHLALRSMNQVAHFTQYIPGHAHLGLLFFSASTVIGGVYYTLPRICSCEIYSRTIGNAGYLLHTFGFAAFFTGFTLTGVVQGSNWVNAGLPVWTTLPALRTWMALRAMGGALLVMGFALWAFNVFATVIASRAIVRPTASGEPGETRTGLRRAESV